jgi:hypothetical protein
MHITTTDNRPATAVVRPSARRAGQDVLVITDDNTHAVLAAMPVEHVTTTILATVVDDRSAATILDDLNGN